MVWDLRRALLKKQENETARLIDFEFRLRARTMRLLAPQIDPALSADALVREIAIRSDAVILNELATRFPNKAETIKSLHATSEAIARKQLIEEIGDPSPVRLA